MGGQHPHLGEPTWEANKVWALVLIFRRSADDGVATLLSYILERTAIHLNNRPSALRSTTHRGCAQRRRRRLHYRKLGYEPAEPGVIFGCARWCGVVRTGAHHTKVTQV